ncbi:MAG TPA: hypothetical protein VKR56_06295 [Candidatus Cybelea sp.]|nr:hypothetical protein [Candidatus Cybelea sp.]
MSDEKKIQELDGVAGGMGTHPMPPLGGGGTHPSPNPPLEPTPPTHPSGPRRDPP